jgi:hypothetical protein
MIVLPEQGLRNVTGKSWQQGWPLLPFHHIRFPAHRPVIGFSAPTGYSGVFIDPDGHPWEIAHNPGWTL